MASAMNNFNKVQTLWLRSCLCSILLAMFCFDGTKTSDVAGILVYFMLIVCLPISGISFWITFYVIDAFESCGVEIYSSRFALLTIWMIYFIFGFIQWIVIPMVIKKYRT